MARNTYGARTISWNLDTGKENITSTNITNINESSDVIILVEHSYASSKVYLTNATINDSTYDDYTEGVAIP